MPQTYRGREVRRHRAHTPNRKKAEKINPKNWAKKYFAKFVKQTGFVVAIILALYITSAVAPNFWANISPTIHAALERDIDITGMYNDVVERFFPSESNGGEDELTKPGKSLIDECNEECEDYNDDENYDSAESHDASPIDIDYYGGLA